MAINAFAKDLSTGSYDLLVLDVLRDGRAYGYDIVKRIRIQSHGMVTWHKGSLYRVLHDLERRRWVVSVWSNARAGRRRRYYRLTPPGRRVWREQREQWRQFARALNALLGLK